MSLGDNHHAALELRSRTQENDKESRDDARESVHFLHDKWGHWEQNVSSRWGNRPKYQIDLTKPVIDRIAGFIETKEFGGSIIPSGNEATDEIAETYEGMMRTIDNMSDAQDIYKDAARNIIECGFDAWLIRTDYSDVDGFDQDIIIDRIPNAIDRAWLCGLAEAKTQKDIPAGFVDTFLSMEDYKAKFPDGSAQSVSEAANNSYYQSNRQGVYVTDFYYLKEESVIMHLMSNGKVYRDDQLIPVRSQLAQQGVTVEKTKTRKVPRCYMRKMDASGWLTDEKETPFRYIPIVGCFANLKIIETRAVYYGETLKMMDPQRIYNYAVSREIADGALAPVRKIVKSTKQHEGFEAQSRKLNTSNDPEYLYKPDKEAPPPYEIGGPQPNLQLQTTANRAQQDIKEITQSFSAVQGEGISGHSGKAYDILTENSDTSSYKYIKSIKRAVATTYEIIIDAIPRVYDTAKRQVMLTDQSGKTSFAAVNESIATPNGVQILNDLSQGRYTFKATAGPSYDSKQSETADVMTEWAKIDPSILTEGSDIIYGSMNQPGMSQLAERKRKSMIEAGMIPESQLTDDEREKIAQQMQAQQDQQQPDPIDQATVSAIMAEVQNIQSQMEERQSQMQIAIMEQQRKMMETVLKAQKQESDIQKTQSETLENLRDATGADAVVSPNVAKAYSDVSGDIANGTPSLPTQN